VAYRYDIPNVTTEQFWTFNRWYANGDRATAVDEPGRIADWPASYTENDTVCVTTPTN
jgi:hypothetical protein